MTYDSKEELLCKYIIPNKHGTSISTLANLQTAVCSHHDAVLLTGSIVLLPHGGGGVLALHLAAAELLL